MGKIIQLSEEYLLKQELQINKKKTKRGKAEYLKEIHRRILDRTEK